MPEEIRLWKIEQGDQLNEYRRSGLDLEERLERWLERDISILAPNLLVIGRQVETAFGGMIDLLCINDSGDPEIVRGFDFWSSTSFTPTAAVKGRCGTAGPMCKGVLRSHATSGHRNIGNSCQGYARYSGRLLR